ncbi:J domain-containing protein [Sphingomicrobium sediminis]|uniref:J domain-containing protein n=1 Tax=Sphingomicrobium sediminis TaxID=2950949 RepID=A0A9X2EG87_9SPHN|nr:J domain-containing protein [Sphingomicrobium sediminis]MCM8556927.1 J domain-containing protein [Sphingomicrobium sediminis]
MPRAKRSDDWGFPRWRPYGDKGKEAAKVRLCDRVDCSEVGDRPAPKSPNSPERWYFCEKHAAEYNKNWDYFQGLTKEDAKKRAAEEARDASGFRQSAHYQWAGPGDGNRSREEMRALDLFGLEPDVDFAEVRKVYRARAKELHPDVNPGDEEAAAEFQKVKAAYDVLKSAEDRRLALGS